MKQKAILLSPSFSKTNRARRIVVEVIVAILLVIWLNTGISKLIDYPSFRMQMNLSPLFRNYANFVAFMGPFLEIVLAALLILKRTRLLGLIGSFLLMLFFTGYVIYLMKVLPTLPCNCGGIATFLNWPQHLILNIVLTILAFVGIILLRKSNRQQS